ncbi:30S ribosome-binding factor RbfA [Hydrogenobaculum sp.]
MSKQKDMLKRTIEKEVANILVKDIENIPGFVTVNGVLLSEDGKNVLISISVLEKDKEDAVLKRLQSARDYIRHLLSRRIKTKSLPKIDFVVSKED